MIQIIMSFFIFRLNQPMKKFISEPYRLFFPLGWLLGVWGVTLWILFLGRLLPYPSVVHSYIMIGGFLTAFTAGFLKTAVPRFTGTFHADPIEIAFAVSGIVLLPLVVWFSEALASLCVILSHATLVAFFVRRFLKRRTALPLAFLFIPLSLGFSILGHLMIVLALRNTLDSSFYSLGRLLAFHSFMLGVVLGVGSRLVPAFIGYGPQKEQQTWTVMVALFAFFLSFFVQQLVQPHWGLGIRLGAVAFVVFKVWSIHRLPPIPSKLGYGLWLSCWGVFLGALGSWVNPTQFVQWTHVLFISGFGLMTLMISSRVILSHGGYDLAREGERGIIPLVVGLLIATTILRLFVGASSAPTGTLLLLSSLLWLLTLVVWWMQLGKRSLHLIATKNNSRC